MNSQSTGEQCPQNPMDEVNYFLSNLQRVEDCNIIELTKVAINLLKTLPATRDAVFEYFSKIFTIASKRFIEITEETAKFPGPTVTEEAVIPEIQSVLASLIDEQPTVWSPIICTWSLELLGAISTWYAERDEIDSEGPEDTISESLEICMECPATRFLIEINTKSLSNYMQSNSEGCVKDLLDKWVKHATHFDWVVARVGFFFPTIIITKILSCGLKEFCKIKSYEAGRVSRKFKSVVRILEHLAVNHSSHIRRAILEVFKSSLVQCEISDQNEQEKKSTVPFILQLCFQSPALLSCICGNFKEIITIDVIDEFFWFIEDWCKYFGTEEDFQDIVMKLILRCDKGGIQIVKLLLECLSTEYWSLESEIVINLRLKCKEMLQNLLIEIDASIRFKNPENIMESFKRDIKEINELMLSNDKTGTIVATRLVIFIGSTDPMALIKSITFLLQNAKNSDQLALLVKILTNEMIDKTKTPYCDKGGYLGVVLEQIMSRDIQKFAISNEDTIDLTQMWDNLLLLFKWEKSGRVEILKCQMISKAIYSNLETLTSVFGSEINHVHVIAGLLDELEIPTTKTPLTLNSQVLLNLTQSTVNYFFACCVTEDSGSKILGFKKVYSILKRLCIFSKASKVLALRELLERALFRSDNVLFGAQNTEKYTNDEDTEPLLLQNKKISKTIPLTKQTSVIRGGILGKRKLVDTNELSPETISQNIAEFMSAIKACCSLPDEAEVQFCDVSLESMAMVSLTLVQFVCPDIMYNGLPWPDADFSKVTIERDLKITKCFQTMPMLWDLLNFVAIYRPSLCYCSVLLRALTATLIHQWGSVGDLNKTNATQQYNQLLEETIKLIDVMALGQLLPPPLSMIRDVLPHLKSFEIVVILRECVWFYMRDHAPSPSLFKQDKNEIHWRDPSISRPPDIYTNPLRIIMQRNIKTLGDVFSNMFINIPKQK